MTVRATMATDDRAVLVGAPSVTDGDGRFRLELPAGNYELAATSPEITAGMLADVAVERFTPRSGIELSAGGPGRTLSGRVRDLHGRPAAGALAGAFQVAPKPRDALLLVKADARGHYRVRVPPGRYIPLALDDDGLRLARPPVDVTADRRVDLELARKVELAEPPPPAVRDWLHGAAKPLMSVEAGHGFEDLASLGRMIGKARLVAVGEATHGTREFSQMKHRILEYVVSQLGFSVFLMEAGMGDAAALDDYIMTGQGDIRSALRTGVYRIWYTEELLAMVAWMRAWNADPAHTTKLRVYGIDVQVPARAMTMALGYLERVDPAAAARAREQLAPMRSALGASEYDALPAEARAAMHDGIRDLLARFDAERAAWSQATRPRDWLIARKSLDVLRQSLAMRAPPRGELASDQRDKGMAENAAWVLDHAEPGARAMLWAHNGHIARCGYDGTISVGQRLGQQRSRDYVAFGFVWNQGGFGAFERGGPWAHQIGPEAAGGLGATFAELGLPRAAFDLLAARGAVASWLAAPHRFRDIGALFTSDDHLDEVTRLSTCFDAVLFIDRTSAARQL
jgi:erythromycin esterase